MRQTITLLSTSVSLFRQVFADCCEPLLGDGPSRRYLCDPCIGAWVPTPPRLNGALVRFFPFSIGLPLGVRGLAHGNFPTKQLHVGRYSRGCNHSLIFRLPYLLGPPTVLTIRNCIPSATGPYTPGSTCAVTEHRLRHHYVSEPDN